MLYGNFAIVSVAPLVICSLVLHLGHPPNLTCIAPQTGLPAGLAAVALSCAAELEPLQALLDRRDLGRRRRLGMLDIFLDVTRSSICACAFVTFALRASSAWC